MRNDVLIVNNAEPDVRDFVEPFEAIVRNKGLRVRTLEYRDLNERIVQEHPCVMLSASPKGDDIVESHQVYYSWLSLCDRPILGICAGHHIIGRFFGGELLRNIESEDGFTQVRVVKKDDIFPEDVEEFEVLQMHLDSVTCPDDFIILATSKRCKNQIMRHCYKPIYSTQFHAELSTDWLILSFLKISGL